MIKKICNIIEQNFGVEQVTVLKKDIIDEDSLSLVYNMISEKNANLLIECLLEKEDEEVYWYIWDNVAYSISMLSDPLPLTQKMKEWYLLGKEEKFNSPFHISPSFVTQRLTLSAMDENTACLLKEEILKEGEIHTFIESLDTYSYKPKMFFSMFRNDTDEPVGYIGLTFVKNWGAVASENTCNLEYYIIPRHRRNGFLLEAAKKIVELAFEGKIETIDDPHHDYFMEKSSATIEMIKIMCDSKNQASCRCAISLGFQEEGTMSFVRDGKIYFEHIFSKNNIGV